MPQVIQQAAGTILAPAGFSTTQISTSAGSWLAAWVGWNSVTQEQYAPLPAVSVTDSAGNLWQQAAITPAAGSASTRCAMWVAANALPVSWVSAGLTGYAASAPWAVAEIAGMPQAASLDFSLGTSATGTAPTLTWIASQPDIGFALAAAGNAAETATSGPSGWTSLGTVTAGAGTTGCAVFPYWNPGISAGTTTSTVTFGTAAAWSYALCALSASASPPPQPSQNFPFVQVEAAFGAQPGNISSSTDYLFSSRYTTWTDITARAIGPAVQGRIKTRRGRQYQLQQQETGTCEIPLSNVDGAFTPTAPGSPYYSNALNANMSFQTSISPWSPHNGAGGATGVSLAQSSAFAYATGLNATARYSMQMSPGGSTAQPGAISERVGINPNYQYTVSAWYNCPAGYATGGNIQVNWYNAAGTFITSTTGTAVPLAAGTWTQNTVTGTPPGNAAFAAMVVFLSGTPSAGAVTYVAEAALAAGSSPVQTGLVTPLTPVRVTAWWQGRRYPVWMGYAQEWPQEWPEMPQWGFTSLKAADALGIAAAGQMPSALIGEVLTDNPYAYLPCNESYTTQVNGATASNPFIVSGGFLQPADANGLAAVNRASGNQVTGAYFDGTNQQVSTGLAMNFLGDNGTGMGATGYSGEVTGQRGPSMLYADPGLTAVASSAGMTIEFWFTWDGTLTQDVTLLTLYGPPSSFMATSSNQTNGALLNARIEGSDLTVTAFNSLSVLALQVNLSQTPQHAVIEFDSNPVGTVTAWLNGVQIPGALLYTPAVTISPVAAVLGPGRYSYDCNNSIITYRGFNFSAGHLAIYPYQLPQARITAHYQAGITGWSGTDAGTRFSQVLTWGQLGLKRGGWNQATATGVTEVTLSGPAYSLSGQSAAAALYGLSQSEGGRYGTQANGSVIYAERDIGYNQPVSAVLADGTAAAPVVLNSDPGFATGTAGWTASGGAVAASALRYGLIGSLQVTSSGTTPATVASPSFSYNGGSAAGGFWVNLPSGGTATCSVITSAGTATAVMGASGSAWTFIPVSVPAASPVSSATLKIAAGTAPWYLAWAALWYSPGQVPYLPQSSYGFDQAYLYNEVTSVQQYGPSQLVTYDNRGTASQQQFFRRSALSFTQNVVSPYDVSDVTTWSLAEYQQPALRVSAVTVDAAPNPLQAFSLVLSLDGGQASQVNRNPVGGAPIAELGTVERVQHDIGAGYWRTGYQLSPYGPGQAVLCADTPGFNAPGTTPSLTLSW